MNCFLLFLFVFLCPSFSRSPLECIHLLNGRCDCASVGLAGMEIGLWNSIGYISQAIGLRTTAASTVRRRIVFFCLIDLFVRMYSNFAMCPIECIHLLNGRCDCASFRLHLWTASVTATNCWSSLGSIRSMGIRNGTTYVFVCVR